MQPMICPHCGTAVHLEDHDLGHWITCADCGRGFTANEEEADIEWPVRRSAFSVLLVMVAMVLGTFATGFGLGLVARSVLR